MNRVVFTIIFILVSTAALGQRKMTNKEYVAIYAEIAMDKMREFKIPASITLAQGILESGSGGSRLAVEANNHFGIKCGSRWTGTRIYHDDDAKGECFRKYRSPEESYKDHSLFLTQNQRYSGLFALDIMDYKGWAKGLKAAGYATNPQYPVLLVKLIEDNELWRYDQQGATGTRREKGGLVGWLEKRDQKAQSAEDQVLIPGQKTRINGVKCVIATAGQTFESIAQTTGVDVHKLLMFNELSQTQRLSEGSVIYLAKKKNRSRSNYMHRSEQGETLYDISQRYGVRVGKLSKLNSALREGVALEPGTYVKLR